jgi:tetratricopeptide (TPR) repeat protein
MAATDAEALKQRGNVAYTAGRLEEARELYSQAVGADPTNAVYRSNRSACLFELGRYVECGEDVAACLELLRLSGAPQDDDKAKALRSKLLRRQVMCALLGTGKEADAETSHADAAAEVLRLAQAALDDAGAGGDKKLREVADWARAQGQRQVGDPSGVVSPMPRLRPRLRSELEEFFPCGNDSALSALAGELQQPDGRASWPSSMGAWVTRATCSPRSVTSTCSVPVCAGRSGQ